MIRAHTVEQVRAAEAELMAQLPEGALMQRAAVGLAHAVLDLLSADGPDDPDDPHGPGGSGAYGRHVLLLVGGGDNGGDALFAGAHLARRGVAVSAWSLSDHPHQAGRTALLAAGGRMVDAVPRRTVDLVLDAVVGIGGRPGLRPDAAAALEALAGVPVLAVDTPSGVGVDTGELPPSDPSDPSDQEAGPAYVSAMVTVTFGTHKLAHLLDPAAQAAGAVHLVDIGLGSHLPEPAAEALQPHDVAALLPRPGGPAQKYSRGVVGVRAGSADYPGAGLLSVAGAACGLAGMVRYVGDDAVAHLVHAAHPEVVAGRGRVQAWIVGSGGGDAAGDSLGEALDDSREQQIPVVVDADALTHLPAYLPDDAAGRGRLILTPHAGELARLLDVEREAVEAAPLAHARQAVERFGATVLLKGRRTLVVAPDGRLRVNTTGLPWLATAGAGDVLGGLVATLAAAGLAPLDAASVGAWLHGAAASFASEQVAGGPIVAGDVARALPTVIGRLLPDSAT